MDGLTKFAFENGIKDKGVYLLSGVNSNAAMSIETATKVLERYGYYVIADKEAVMPKEWNPDNIHFMEWKGKLCAILGNKQ